MRLTGILCCTKYDKGLSVCTQQKKYRKLYQLFIAEGVKVIQELLNSGKKIQIYALFNEPIKVEIIGLLSTIEKITYPQIKEMEDLGIGRPSTYSQTITTLKTRKYVSLSGRA